MWRKGDRIGRRRRVVEEDYWDYCIGPTLSSDFEPQLRALLDAISPGANYLAKLRSGNEVQFLITLAAWVPGNPLSYVPIASIDQGTMSEIAKIGAGLQFDINLLGEDNSEASDSNAMTKRDALN